MKKIIARLGAILAVAALALGLGMAPASAALVNPDFPIVRGERSVDVKQYQNNLICAGYLAKGLNTGYFGSRTAAATKRLKRDNDLGGSKNRVNLVTYRTALLECQDVTGPGNPSSVTTGRSNFR